MSKIRLLIAEDSEAMRATLEALIALDPRIEIVGVARDGREALLLAKSLRPDVITMDVVMPQIDGVEATAQIMAECPARILIVTAHADDRQIDLSFRAMGAGALEVVSKPAASSPSELRGWVRRVCDTIVLMGEVPVITRSRRTPANSRRADVVGIAASTGGPIALAQIFGGLPASLSIPVLVAQHLADGFTDGLIRWLRTVTPLTITVAAPGALMRPGHIYFPPDRCDLEVSTSGVLQTPKASGRYTPSGDLLFASLARSLRGRAAGIVLTGMGEDGALGLRALRDAGGTTIAQSAETCVVNGMPQAAVQRGATTDLRPLDAMAAAIIELAQGPATKK